MNLYHLKYFLDAVKFQSLSKSAQANFVTHSAVSQAIKSLESQIGQSLLKHGKRKFELTEVGKNCIPRFEKILNDFSAIKTDIDNHDKEPFGELSIWLPQSLLIDSTYKAIINYKKKYPKVILKINTGAAYLVRQNVLSQKCHLGIALDDQLMNQFQGEFLGKGEFVLVSKKKSARLLDSEILVTNPEKSEVVVFKNEFRKVMKQNPIIKTYILSWGAIREFVKQGLGIGFLPDYLVRNEIEKGSLYKIEFKGHFPKYKIKAIWHPEIDLTFNAKLFLDELKCHAT